MLPSATTGIVFTNVLPLQRNLTNQILPNGSGVAAGDVDGDGWTDLYFNCIDGPNVLYRNLGNWQFQDITAAAGVACPNLDASGAAFADLDGDGDLDLVVNSWGQGTHVFFNQGKGRFAEGTKNVDLNANRGGTTAALGDIEGDGDLDLYVANYRTISIRDQPNTRFSFRVVDGKPIVTAVDGRPLTDPDLTNRFTFRISMADGTGTFGYEENGEPDVLYVNDGTGRFTSVSFTGGAFLDEQGRPLANPPLDWGSSVLMRDLNGDRAPDIHVCNDFRSPDRTWINDGQGHFRAIGPLAIRHWCISSMGLDVADINRDGHDDIFTLDMLSRDHKYRHTQRVDLRPDVLPIGAVEYRPQYSQNMLFLNRGDGTYAEIANLAGLEAAEWAWTPLFLDVDLDGYEDVLIPNGFERDNMSIDVLEQLGRLKKTRTVTAQEQLQMRKLFPRLETPNLAFRNLGNLRFEDKSAEWGFNTPAISQGTALADLDNDGDLDVVINNMNSAAGIYRNDSPAPRIGVRLKGKAPNTRGIGAKIRVRGGPVPQSQEMMAGGRYLSSDDPMRVFACGQATDGLTIEVTWRSGKRSVVANAKPNRIYEVDEAPATEFVPVPVPAPRSLFQDVSDLLRHQHPEELFDDFSRQPMLSRKLSQLGPGVAWFDVDSDGWDDLLIASGRGGQMAVYRNDGRGGFQVHRAATIAPPVTRDQTAVVGWRQANGQAVALAGASHYEDGLAMGCGLWRFEFPAQTAAELLPAAESAFGPLALADVDGDGDLDLFVGGRVIPGRYPEPASSLLFLSGADGRLMPDLDNNKRLTKVGLVSGAVFSDFDGDGDPDLILACDWGPIRVFRNDRGKLNDATESLGLGYYLGWWNGVTTGDFDGDGRLDIAASNWGRNTRFEYYRKGGLYLYFGDVDGNGTIETIEGYHCPGMTKLAPIQPLNLLRQAVPLLAEPIGTCVNYSQLSLEEIYGAPLNGLPYLKANWLETTVFLNRTNRFEARELPVEAQFSPAFAVNVADLDGDGHEDLFFSQNFFEWSIEYPRNDAGLALCLRGDGRGRFQALSVQESGVRAHGDQRGAALCDYDGDGRVDVVITQNAAETKLFHNVAAQPGLRVRLAGPTANPHGVGALLRLVAGNAAGPAREIHAGSGYWSQDSVTQVMTLPTPQAPTRLWIRWPGGKSTTTELPANAREITVDQSGKLVRALP